MILQLPVSLTLKKLVRTHEETCRARICKEKDLEHGFWTITCDDGHQIAYVHRDGLVQASGREPTWLGRIGGWE